MNQVNFNFDLDFEKSEMVKNAMISLCGKYRYKLRRIWDRNKGIACWIMLNPSTADAEKDDPTIKRIIKFTRSWGFGGLVVVNIYPYRSSSPRECKAWAEWHKRGPDWHARDMIICKNWPIVEEEIEKADLVIAAWGAGDWYKNDVDLMIEEHIPCNLYCIGATTDGSPKHPLARGRHRVSDNQKPFLWKGY